MLSDLFVPFAFFYARRQNGKSNFAFRFCFCMSWKFMHNNRCKDCVWMPRPYFVVIYIFTLRSKSKNIFSLWRHADVITEIKMFCKFFSLYNAAWIQERDWNFARNDNQSVDQQLFTIASCRHFDIMLINNNWK